MILSYLQKLNYKSKLKYKQNKNRRTISMCQALGQRSFRAIIKLKKKKDKHVKKSLDNFIKKI